jgi:hypothetical protein
MVPRKEGGRGKVKKAFRNDERERERIKKYAVYIEFNKYIQVIYTYFFIIPNK